MEEFKSYRKESKDDWGTSEEGSLNIDQINCGALLRIADAAELMAKRHQELIKENEHLLRRRQELEADNRRLANRIRGYQGYINRMKKKKRR